MFNKALFNRYNLNNLLIDINNLFEIILSVQDEQRSGIFRGINIFDTKTISSLASYDSEKSVSDLLTVDTLYLSNQLTKYADAVNISSIDSKYNKVIKYLQNNTIQDSIKSNIKLINNETFNMSDSMLKNINTILTDLVILDIVSSIDKHLNTAESVGLSDSLYKRPLLKSSDSLNISSDDIYLLSKGLNIFDTMNLEDIYYLNPTINYINAYQLADYSPSLDKKIVESLLINISDSTLKHFFTTFFEVMDIDSLLFFALKIEIVADLLFEDQALSHKFKTYYDSIHSTSHEALDKFLKYSDELLSSEEYIKRMEMNLSESYNLQDDLKLDKIIPLLTTLSLADYDWTLNKDINIDDLIDFIEDGFQYGIHRLLTFIQLISTEDGELIDKPMNIQDSIDFIINKYIHAEHKNEDSMSIQDEYRLNAAAIIIDNTNIMDYNVINKIINNLDTMSFVDKYYLNTLIKKYDTIGLDDAQLIHTDKNIIEALKVDVAYILNKDIPLSDHLTTAEALLLYKAIITLDDIMSESVERIHKDIIAQEQIDTSDISLVHRPVYVTEDYNMVTDKLIHVAMNYLEGIGLIDEYASHVGIKYQEAYDIVEELIRLDKSLSSLTTLSVSDEAIKGAIIKKYDEIISSDSAPIHKAIIKDEDISILENMLIKLTVGIVDSILVDEEYRKNITLMLQQDMLMVDELWGKGVAYVKEGYHMTLQEAIDKAVNGDTVYIIDDTAGQNAIIKNKNIKLVGNQVRLNKLHMLSDCTVIFNDLIADEIRVEAASKLNVATNCNVRYAVLRDAAELRCDGTYRGAELHIREHSHIIANELYISESLDQVGGVVQTLKPSPFNYDEGRAPVFAKPNLVGKNGRAISPQIYAIKGSDNMGFEFDIVSDNPSTGTVFVDVFKTLKRNTEPVYEGSVNFELDGQTMYKFSTVVAVKDVTSLQLRVRNQTDQPMIIDADYTYVTYPLEFP